MKLHRDKSRPFGLLLAAALFLVMLAVFVVPKPSFADNSGGRLVTIHDRGEEKIILTKAPTIGKALEDAGIKLDSKDTVEPAASQKLVASNYQVNIYRARPVIIVDGNVRQKVVTAYQTAEQITKSVGITLYPEDKTSIARVDDPTEGAGLQLTIKRAVVFTFDLYGTTTTARTQGKTVGDMLSEKNINMTKDDRVIPDSKTPISEGMSIKVWREGKQTVTVNEPIDFPVQNIEDGDMDLGYTAVRTPGVPGSRNVTYDVVIQNGQIVSKTEIASITTKQPVTQVQVVGVKGEYTTPGENENIVWTFLTNNGFTRFQAAGIMGNLMQEHHFETSDVAGGMGIAQWTAERRARLLSYSHPENIYTQLQFLLDELNGPYANVGNAIRGTSTVEGAVYTFQNQFERCGVCMSGQRLQYAYDILASH